MRQLPMTSKNTAITGGAERTPKNALGRELLSGRQTRFQHGGSTHRLPTQCVVSGGDGVGAGNDAKKWSGRMGTTSRARPLPIVVVVIAFPMFVRMEWMMEGAVKGLRTSGCQYHCTQ
jgi:hypothetical protein